MSTVLIIWCVPSALILGVAACRFLGRVLLAKRLHLHTVFHHAKAA